MPAPALQPRCNEVQPVGEDISGETSVMGSRGAILAGPRRQRLQIPSSQARKGALSGTSGGHRRKLDPAGTTPAPDPPQRPQTDLAPNGSVRVCRDSSMDLVAATACKPVLNLLNQRCPRLQGRLAPSGPRLILAPNGSVKQVLNLLNPPSP